jgi:predicted homoserine dehydrogenase-like protein
VVKHLFLIIGKNLVSHESIEIIVECTGNPIAAVEHCLSAFKNQKNVINVTVEADAFCGFALSQKANDAGRHI